MIASGRSGSELNDVVVAKRAAYFKSAQAVPLTGDVQLVPNSST